ncbi:MAG: recombinase family protein [Anaerolineae bacterium]
MRCLIWAAVSSKPQAADEKDSIPSQLAAAREAIQRNEWEETHEPLIVPGHSRNYLFLADAAADIPQYAELMELTRSGSIDLLVCRSYDRLGRTDALVSQVQGYLRHHGVQILSLDMPQQITEPDEYDGSVDRASIWTGAIGRARAEDEMAELRRRHRFGMRRRVKDGQHPNHPPYGYRKTDEGVEVYEEEAELVRFIFSSFLGGQSPYTIRRQLRAQATVPTIRSASGLYYVLRNPFYCGMVGYSRTDGRGRHRARSDWMLAEGQHEALISREDWEAAQLELARRSENRRTPYTRYPLSGLVYCGYCNHRMIIRMTDKGKYRYYVCKTEGCNRNTVKAGDLEQEVGEWVAAGTREQFDLQEMLQTTHDRGEEEEVRLQKATQRLQDALDRWRQDYELGLLGRSEFYEHKARLEDELAGVEAALTTATDRKVNPQEITDALERLSSLTGESLAESWHDQENVLAVKAALRQARVRITVRGNLTDITLDLAD